MGQCWKLIDLDSGECLRYLGKMKEGIWDDFTFLVRALHRDDPPTSPLLLLKSSPRSNRDRAQAFGVPPTDFNGNEQVWFGSLPPELVSEIFALVADLEIAVCFGLTNRAVWVCGQTAIHTLFEQRQALRAGHRLICLGEYAESLPRDHRSPEELLSIAKTFSISAFFHKSEMYASLSRASESREWKTDKAYEQSDIDAAMNDSEPSFSKDHMRRFCSLVYRNSGGSYREWKRTIDAPFWRPRRTVKVAQVEQSVSDWELGVLESWLEACKLERSTTHSTPMLLKNLSKKHFVRSDTLKTKYFVGFGQSREIMSDSDPFGAWGFGQAVMYSICWGDADGIGVAPGAWAGDRFEISPAESCDEACMQLITAGWKDHTARIGTLIEELEGECEG